jgi:hypothetical protein
MKRGAAAAGGGGVDAAAGVAAPDQGGSKQTDEITVTRTARPPEADRDDRVTSAT